MKKETIIELKKKGWSHEDIQKANKIIDSRKEIDKSRTFGHSNRILYWTIITVIIIGNFMISIGLIPVLLALNKVATDVIVVIVGFGFGLLFNMLINDVESINKRHHLIALILIPLVALINLAVIATVTNVFNEVLQLTNVRADPISMSIFYVVAFLVPYLWTVLVRRKS